MVGTSSLKIYDNFFVCLSFEQQLKLACLKLLYNAESNNVKLANLKRNRSINLTNIFNVTLTEYGDKCILRVTFQWAFKTKLAMSQLCLKCNQLQIHLT